MGDKKKQYYVVVKGRKPGIYTKWFGSGEASDQIQGFPEAVYKGFFTREEAVNWLKEFPVETLISLAPNLVEFIDEDVTSQDENTESPHDLLQAGKVVIFTDGGAINNPGPGGYGIVLKYKEHRKELSGGFRITTNNRMEVFACISGLAALKQKSDVVIFSDSKYVVESISKGWAKRWQSNNWMRNHKEKAENSDLWAKLLGLCEEHNVEFRWLKGHNGSKENERCDRLAVEASNKKDLPVDVGFEESGESENTAPLFSGLSA